MLDVDVVVVGGGGVVAVFVADVAAVVDVFAVFALDHLCCCLLVFVGSCAVYLQTTVSYAFIAGVCKNDDAVLLNPSNLLENQ